MRQNPTRQRQATHAARKAKGRRLHMAQTVKRWRRVARPDRLQIAYWPALLARRQRRDGGILTFGEAQALGWT